MKITTQIGSLPYDNVSKAIEYSLAHDIPFLPELPLLGDSMLEYIKNPGQLSCLEDFRSETQGADIIKIQSIGPATLINSGYSEDIAVEKVYTHISKILDRMNAKEVILFLDEPALGHTGIDYISLWQVIFSQFNVKKGIHVCGNMDWDKLFESEIEIISHDSTKYDITIYPKYRNNKIIAWGIKDYKDIRDFQEEDLLTLPCGIGPKINNEDDAKKSLELLTLSADKLR